MRVFKFGCALLLGALFGFGGLSYPATSSSSFSGIELPEFFRVSATHEAAYLPQSAQLPLSQQGSIFGDDNRIAVHGRFDYRDPALSSAQARALEFGRRYASAVGRILLEWDDSYLGSCSFFLFRYGGESYGATASHCFYDETKSYMALPRAAYVSFDGGGHKVEKRRIDLKRDLLISHPDYRTGLGSLGKDYAIFRLDQAWVRDREAFKLARRENRVRRDDVLHVMGFSPHARGLSADLTIESGCRLVAKPQPFAGLLTHSLMATNCDFADGNSGAAVLVERNNELMVAGIAVGFYVGRGFDAGDPFKEGWHASFVSDIAGLVRDLILIQADIQTDIQLDASY